MNKKFEIIPIEDYEVVVDKENIKEGLDYEQTRKVTEVVITPDGIRHIACTKDKLLWCREDMEMNWTYGKWYNITDCKRVIATINKRIDDIPLIEIGKDLELTAQESYMNNKAVKLTWDAYSYKEGFKVGYKAAGGYSEEDIRTAFQDGIDFRTDTTEFGSEIELVKKGRFANLIKSLQPKLPKSVVLEIDKICGMDGELVTKKSTELWHLGGTCTQFDTCNCHCIPKITNPSTNTIIPISYE